MAQDLALDVQQCSKTYASGTQALIDLNFTIPKGAFSALLGPNGAGKTTLIGIITSLINKTSGQVNIFDYSIDTHWSQAKMMLGVVPQETNFSIFETAHQITVNQAGYYGVPRRLALQRAEHYLKKLHLWPKRHVQSRFLSGGMKRRLMIARALMHEPQLLILDEPTAGVDIEIRHEMWDYLKELNTNGLSILLTTHYLEEAEQLCRYTTIIDQGKLLVTDETQKLLQQMDQESYSLGLHKPLLSPLPKAPFPCRQVNDNNIEIDLTKQHSLNDAFAFLSQHNITVNHIQNKSNRLETLFLNQLKKKS